MSQEDQSQERDTKKVLQQLAELKQIISANRDTMPDFVGPGLRVRWHNDEIGYAKNGAHVRDLLETAIRRLHHLDLESPCEVRMEAIGHIKAAMSVLMLRNLKQWESSLSEMEAGTITKKSR